MKTKLVEVQEKFSGDGKFTEAVYAPQIVDELMQEVYNTVGSSKGLNRLRISFAAQARAGLNDKEAAFLQAQQHKAGREN